MSCLAPYSQCLPRKLVSNNERSMCQEDASLCWSIRSSILMMHFIQRSSELWRQESGWKEFKLPMIRTHCLKLHSCRPLSTSRPAERDLSVWQTVLMRGLVTFNPHMCMKNKTNTTDEQLRLLEEDSDNSLFPSKLQMQKKRRKKMKLNKITSVPGPLWWNQTLRFSSHKPAFQKTIYTCRLCVFSDLGGFVHDICFASG